jgi:hypothetical protein
MQIHAFLGDAAEALVEFRVKRVQMLRRNGTDVYQQVAACRSGLLSDIDVGAASRKSHPWENYEVRHTKGGILSLQTLCSEAQWETT